MKSTVTFWIFLFYLSWSCTTATEGDNDNSEPPSFINWLFGSTTKIESPHSKSNSTGIKNTNSTVNNNKTTSSIKKSRQLLYNPNQALLLQQQQQLQAAALNQAIINQRLQNSDFDDSSEEDDFDSDEFWHRSPLRSQHPVLGGGGLRLYRSGEVDSREDPGYFSNANRTLEADSSPQNGTTTHGVSTTTTSPRPTSRSTTLSPNWSHQKNDNTTTTDSTSTQSGSDSTTTTTTIPSMSSTTTKKPNRRIPPYDANANCRCGMQVVQQMKVRDTQVGINSYPWMVAISAHSQHLCTGEIINSKFIITVASCLQGVGVQDMTIIGGLLSANKTRFTASRVFIHPQYNADTKENNLALIQVQEEIEPSNSIKFVCLPIGKKPKLDSGTLVTWIEPNNQNLTLVEAQVQQVKDPRCKELLATVNATLNPGTFCAAPPPQKQCGNDIGGSYLTHGKGYSFTLSGVISYNGGCKKKGIPAVMTNIHLYVRWILFKSQVGSYCKNPTFKPNELSQLPE